MTNPRLNKKLQKLGRDNTKLPIKLIQCDNLPNVSLQSLTDVSRSLNLILKDSCRSLYGQKFKSNEFKIYVGSFQNGSLIFDIIGYLNDILTDPVQKSFFTSSYSAFDIIMNAQKALEFWKIYSEKKEEGRQVNINITNSPGVHFSYNESGQINISSNTFDTAVQIANHGDELVRPIKNKELRSIELGAGADKFVLTSKNQNCFKESLDTSEDLKLIRGNLVEFNKFTKKGSVVYLDNLKKVKRKFSLADGCTISDTIESMKREMCKLYCYEQFIPAPNGHKKVVRLIVEKIEKVN